MLVTLLPTSRHDPSTCYMLTFALYSSFLRFTSHTVYPDVTMLPSFLLLTLHLTAWFKSGALVMVFNIHMEFYCHMNLTRPLLVIWL